MHAYIIWRKRVNQILINILVMKAEELGEGSALPRRRDALFIQVNEAFLVGAD